ncbi:tRNA adenosine(34) deaminase TadA [Denitrificimonas sp. JX-1]|uniref:tRNA-specific adenosine deaminase n=1 Tax=Denitrificimonas halotolerans TaxID=3098930 RepID=A0ABU5GMQ1_9GAMM|nr:tRNA adenosine(34) deaminase TadA [Denitrificimonas sp. JX-1]MDY7218195.1 tRNA adenosine(34) deaminase TadA [Denitrificimonas sp. JX-1]
MPDQNNATEQDILFMQEALQLAEQGAALGEVPVGAVLVQEGEIIGRGFNCPISLNDPSAHAEVQAIRDAATQLKNYRLPQTTLYVTLEPCHMCAGLIVHARIAKVVFAASEPRAGAVESRGCFFSQSFLNHRVVVEGGVLARESAQMLRAFFRARR